MKKLHIILAITFFVFFSGWAQTSNFSYGFETTASGTGDDWNSNIEVTSGTDGITAATGNFYGKMTAAGCFTRFGGYNSVFPLI